ncbi:hypothetical protein C8J56DRAFT_925137 [Mycena floridula]|nr:hypothetical protein C8J56DRAFT_925137 [Mycena floridula]
MRKPPLRADHLQSFIKFYLLLSLSSSIGCSSSMTGPFSEPTGVPPYSSAVLSLLASNEALTSSEEILLRTDMAQSRLAVLAIKEKIAAHRKEILSLEKNLKDTEKFIHTHEIVLAPHRRVILPPEILCEIFAYAGPVDTDSKKGIWVFGRVCQYWRRVLLDAGPLWAKMRIFLLPGSQYTAAIVDTMLARSKDAPLDITFTFSTYYSRPCADVIKSLVAASDRWQNVNFRLSNLSNLQMVETCLVFSEIKGRLALLEVFSISGDLPSVFDWFQHAPKLRFIDLHLSEIEAQNIKLPWSQLKFCEIESMTFSDQLFILARCSALQQFTLSQDTKYTTPVGEIACLPELEELTLKGSYVSRLLEHILVPLLTDVVVYADSLQRLSIPTRFSNLVERSSCRITRLVLYTDSWSRKIDVAFLLLVPLQSLESLTIMAQMNPPGLLNSLTLQETKTTKILPTLRWIQLVFAAPIYAQEPELFDRWFPALAAMVESRWNIPISFQGPVKRLESLNLQMNEIDIAKGAGRLVDLKPLVQDGLRLSIDQRLLENSS